MRFINVTINAWSILIIITLLKIQQTYEQNGTIKIVKSSRSKHYIIKTTTPSSNHITFNNNDSETKEKLINTITKNITKILNEYETTQNDLNIPEKLWELNNNTTTKEYITQATQYVTPDNMTQLKYTLDNLESYKQFKNNKKNSQSPIISVTDIDNFNEFITNITNKGLQLRNELLLNKTHALDSNAHASDSNAHVLDTTESIAHESNPFEMNKESIMQIFHTLTDDKNQSDLSVNQLKRESIDNDIILTDKEIHITSTESTTTMLVDIESTTNENINVIEDFDQILLDYISSTRLDSFINESASMEMELPKPMILTNSSTVDKENNFQNGSAEILAREIERLQMKEIEDAAEYGLSRMKQLYEDTEPKLYKMGLWLEKDNPAHFVAQFNAQQDKSKDLAKFGYASLEATTKLASQFKEPESRASASAFEELTASLRQTSFHDLCPLRGPVQCSSASKRYRTADGTCNNAQEPRRGAALLPMQRFLSPQYHDGIQSVRRSIVHNRPLPSAREISITVHGDRNIELTAVTHMLMQWGQFIDHDVTQSAQSRGFNGSVPRCCLNGGQDFQSFENTHPDCLPIAVPPFDWFLSPFGIRCMEFVRSAPASRFDCSLGWREQINQVTAYIDASNVYGSSVEQAESLRTFHDGLLAYAHTNPATTNDEAERCQRGANSFVCIQSGDGRVSEQPGLTAMGIVWVRQHNLIATKLSRENPHWSDEKTYQETRRIIIAMIQHITYREFLPIILGPEVIDLFGLQLLKTGFYEKYNSNVKPEIANSFSGAAFRFGHSIVQHSFIRADRNHRLLTNNVTLHEERNNMENIWRPRSVDRILLGMCNQPSQKRDEFISVELTNHLFQTSRFSFGMDLAAINIQRGRDHGLPTYTSWRTPCGLSSVQSWSDLQKIMSLETVSKLQSLYEHFDDIDLFTGGLSEKPVRGGLVGPTFACIIAQQFSNLRQGDRFWYENGNFESSFTLAQLKQIRKITLSQVMCSSMQDVETVQPFVFLTADNLRNERISCLDPVLNSFDLLPWIENNDFQNDDSNNLRTNENSTNEELTVPANIDETLDQNLLRESIDQDLIKHKTTLNDTTEKSDQLKDNNNSTTTNMTDKLNSLLLSRNSLFPGEVYKIEEAQLALQSKRNNKRYSNFTTLTNYENRPQLTTTMRTTDIDSKSIHGYGSEDWYDEFPKPANLPHKDKYRYSTTIAPAYSLQTFQSVVANPTKPSRYTTHRAPPSSSNPDLDELDLHYDLKSKIPKPSDITYLIGVVDDKTTDKDKKTDYGQATYGGQATQTYYEKHHHNKPYKPHHKPQNTHYDFNRPLYTTTTKRYDSNYYPPWTTTKRYTIRPQNPYETDNYYPITTEDYYRPTTSRPRPIPTQRPLPPQNGYNDDGYNFIRPITERPNRPDNSYYGNSHNRPNRPTNSDGYFGTSNNRPIRPQNDFIDISTENSFININRPSNNRPIIVRPENDIEDSPIYQRPTSRPILIQNRPDNGYNQPTNNNDYYRPTQNRPTSNSDSYGDSNDRPSRPGFIDLTNRPQRPQVDDEQFSFVYGQVSNPNYGRPTRPTNQYDYNNDPNFYGDRTGDGPRPLFNGEPTDEKPRPIINNNEQPVKLFYIGNVLHEVREGEKPSVTNPNQNAKQTTFVKISSVSGHYNDKITTKSAYVSTTNNFKKENLEDDSDLEIDESLHLYEAIQETLQKQSDKSSKTGRNTQETLRNFPEHSKSKFEEKMLLPNETTQQL